MAVIKESGLIRHKDSSGNDCEFRPVTNADNVEGLSDLIDEAKILGKSVMATGDGTAYTVTVPGITSLEVGTSFLMIPDVSSTSIAVTLNVNNLGAKLMRMRASGYTSTAVPPATTNWMFKDKPVRVVYNGTYWLVDGITRPNAADIYGNVKAEKVSYDNTNSGLTSKFVQAAIDELAGSMTSAQVLTTAEYEAIETKDENTLYMLSDDTTEDDIQTHIQKTDIHVSQEFVSVETTPTVSNKICWLYA